MSPKRSRVLTFDEVLLEKGLKWFFEPGHICSIAVVDLSLNTLRHPERQRFRRWTKSIPFGTTPIVWTKTNNRNTRQALFELCHHKEQKIRDMAYKVVRKGWSLVTARIDRQLPPELIDQYEISTFEVLIAKHDIEWFLEGKRLHATEVIQVLLASPAYVFELVKAQISCKEDKSFRLQNQSIEVIRTALKDLYKIHPVVIQEIVHSIWKYKIQKMVARSDPLPTFDIESAIQVYGLAGIIQQPDFTKSLVISLRPEGPHLMSVLAQETPHSNLYNQPIEVFHDAFLSLINSTNEIKRAYGIDMLKRCWEAIRQVRGFAYMRHEQAANQWENAKSWPIGKVLRVGSEQVILKSIPTSSGTPYIVTYNNEDKPLPFTTRFIAG